MRVRHRGLISSIRRFSSCFPTSYTTSITSLMEARRIIEAAAALAAQRAAARDLPELNAHIWERGRRRCKSQPCLQTPGRDDRGSVTRDLRFANPRIDRAQSRALSARRRCGVSIFPIQFRGLNRQASRTVSCGAKIAKPLATGSPGRLCASTECVAGSKQKKSALAEGE